MEISLLLLEDNPGHAQNNGFKSSSRIPSIFFLSPHPDEFLGNN
jgi:hypothetical protein